MDLNSKQRHKLRKFLNELRKYRANHTEFVTIYVPHGYTLVKVIQQLQDEQGTASNIKSASTRKNVQAALEKMIQHLRVIDKTPQNGLVAFSGNIAAREGQQDVKVWSIEPPVPLNQRIYRCEKTFVLDALEKMLEETNVYGLIVMDRRDANIALLRGKTIIPLTKTHSEVPGKFRAGGQSAQRFERLIEGAAKNHYKKVADYVKDQFLHLKNLKGIIVGGPGPTKYTFAEGTFITDQLKRKIIGIKDLTYTGDFGLQELVDKSQDLLADEEIAQEKKLLGKFFQLLATEEGKVSYGKKEVKKSLTNGYVDTLILSEGLDDKTIDELSYIAEENSSKVSIVSTSTREGIQLRDIGGVAAILRFNVAR